MITENKSTLKLHKLSEQQYKREYTAGNTDNTDFYLTPDSSILFTPQMLSESQKAQARANLGIQENGDASQLLIASITGKSTLSHTFEQLYSHAVNNGLLVLYNGSVYCTLISYNNSYLTFINMSSSGLAQIYVVHNDNNVSFFEETFQVHSAIDEALNNKFKIIRIDELTTAIDYTSYDLLELLAADNYVAVYDEQGEIYYTVLRADFKDTEEIVFGSFCERTGYYNYVVVDREGTINRNSFKFAPSLVVTVNEQTGFINYTFQEIKKVIDLGGAVTLKHNGIWYSYDYYQANTVCFSHIDTQSRQIQQVIVNADNSINEFVLSLEQYEVVDTLPSYSTDGKVVYLKEKTPTYSQDNAGNSINSQLLSVNACSIAVGNNAWFTVEGNGNTLYSGTGTYNDATYDYSSKVELTRPDIGIDTCSQVIVKLKLVDQSSPIGCIGYLSTEDLATNVEDLSHRDSTLAYSYAYRDPNETSLAGINQQPGEYFYFVFDLDGKTMPPDKTYYLYLQKCNDQYSGTGWTEASTTEIEVQLTYTIFSEQAVPLTVLNKYYSILEWNYWITAGHSLYSGKGYNDSTVYNWCSKIDFKQPDTTKPAGNKVIVKLVSNQKSSPIGCIGVLASGVAGPYSIAVPKYVYNNLISSEHVLATSLVYKDTSKTTRAGKDETSGSTYYLVFDLPDNTVTPDTTYSIFLTKESTYDGWGWCAFSTSAAEITMYYPQANTTTGWYKLVPYQYNI